MKKVLFTIGAILLIMSLPTSTTMIMELVHNIKMNNQYNIFNVSEGYPPTSSTYTFNDHVITIEETITDSKGYKDPWVNQMNLADLSVKLNGEQLDF